jgi:hypothetical protein
MTKTLTIGLVVAIIVIFAGLFTPLTFLNREQYRAEVRVLDESLQPGMTGEHVRRVIESNKFPHLRFQRVGDQMWSVAAPYEFGARNWVLLIEFQGGHVAALRVRTADGIDDHPPEAPPDKTNE